MFQWGIEPSWDRDLAEVKALAAAVSTSVMTVGGQPRVELRKSVTDRTLSTNEVRRIFLLSARGRLGIQLGFLPVTSVVPRGVILDLMFRMPAARSHASTSDFV
jgi:hypothetical protein